MPFSDNNSLRPLYIYTTASLIVVAVLSSILSYLVLGACRDTQEVAYEGCVG